MPKLKFRLCDEDRTEFGGEEWETFDHAKFENARAGELERYERETGIRLEVIMAAANGEVSAAGVRALVWIARHQRGLRTPFKDFDIHTLKIRSEYVPDEELPEATAPLDPSSDGSATSP